jgi:group I intron endonuclease
LYAIFFVIVYFFIKNLINKSEARNRIKNIKYNKFNNKAKNLLNTKNFNIRSYSTISSLDKGKEPFCSEGLISIMKDLDLNPIYIFENLKSENIRKEILEKSKGLSGIYMIVNKITKDYYIGSAATNKFYARFSNHLIYFRGSKILKSAVKKYELKNFAFIILDLYSNIVTKENNKELLDLEDKYLKLLLPNYNILTEAGSRFGYKHTEVDRPQLKYVFNDARREMIKSLNKYKKFSLETIEQIRAKSLNRPIMSDEITKKCITLKRPVVLYNLNGTVYGYYCTILEAANSINCSEKTIRRALKTDKGLVKRQ